MSLNNYEDRIVLFLDILGFREVHVANTVNNGKDCEGNIASLYKSLDTMRSFLNGRLKQKDFFEYRNPSLRVTQFSDSVVISFINDGNETLLKLIRTIQELMVRLIKDGILCRGAIASGRLIHDGKIIFGPALNDAYETESKAAIYPRIIFDKSIIDNGKGEQLFFPEYSPNRIIDNFITRDSDDKYYIDYFPKDLSKYEYKEIKTYFPQLKYMITNGIVNKKPDVRIKYGWMKNKYNAMLDVLKSEDSRKKMSKRTQLLTYINGLSSI
ncbi:MAG: hypothetical protein LBN93_09110 [Candidatus Symbiothrix sp.]|jgi:hypothetical protein|nr:hypothetical protein [Candidatus Symbiothrix sp.]